MEKSIISLKNVTKKYKTRYDKIDVLKDINLEVTTGDFIAVTGESGAGKSTLLNIIGLIDDMTSGTYMLYGNDVNKLNSDEKSEYRAKKICFIFQSYNLFSTMTAYENVEFPLGYLGLSKTERNKRVLECLDMVKLSDRRNHRPIDMSGGEQQRVAIARGMAIDSDIILADEPTGNLDSKTTKEIMNILTQLNDNGKTILLVTHNDHVAEQCKSRLVVENGIIELI